MGWGEVNDAYLQSGSVVGGTKINF